MLCKAETNVSCANNGSAFGPVQGSPPPPPLRNEEVDLPPNQTSTAEFRWKIQRAKTALESERRMHVSDVRRQQKIKCSGRSPCEQCNRRNLSCTFDNKQQKVLVTRSYLANLERQSGQWVLSPPSSLHQAPGTASGSSQRQSFRETNQTPNAHFTSVPRSNDASTRESPSASIVEQADVPRESDSDEPDPDAVPATAEAHLANPLAPGNFPHTYTADSHGRPFYFGTSSNWSFGRRVLNMAHERISDSPLPANSLLFEGSTYELGWDGLRTPDAAEAPVLPTHDFASYLVNSVKFHCGQLYHLFDEKVFMDHFNKFYEDGGSRWTPPILWYIHYHLILAFGKAFVGRSRTGTRPPGAEFFVHAMRMLPDITFLCVYPIEAIEILCCAALYLQCLDHRAAAYNLIGQAARIALDNGMHTEMQSHHLTEPTIERYREMWWTVYVLDRQMSSLLGCPVAFADEDVSARLPSFSGSVRTSMALGIHVKLCKAATVILQTVYGNGQDKSKRFLVKMKEALKTIANANDDRNNHFPLDLKKDGAVSRLSAYLHLFHHQCIILATRPLLFSFWQKRLDSIASLRVTSAGGARSMLRVCVGSSQQSINILKALQSQGLLESFLPFDLEAVFSSAIVLSLANAVDTSLLRDKGPWLQTSFEILDEMVSRGNRIAEFHKSELQQLDVKLKMLPATPRSEPSVRPSSSIADGHNRTSSLASANAQIDPGTGTSMGYDYLLNEWNSDDGLSGEQLMALADSLDFGAIGQLDWLDSEMATF